MDLYEKIKNKEEKISLVGLGYVGMPIAVSFAKKVDVIGFDVNTDKIEDYKNGKDPTNEVGEAAIKSTTVHFTSDANELRNAKFHIVAVPTPISEDRIPDLSMVKAASQTVGENLTKGSYVIYESTVYPGVTEDICKPILENASGLKCGEDFHIGFSPERINPGDKENTLQTIVKVVSGDSPESTEEIAKVYELVVDAGVYKADSIRIAEASKVIENAQRDINIAFMNELSIIFNKMGIDTKAVIEAASTKWNFLKFEPGLVGGHCIGVDPYYLTYKAEKMGYHSQVILSGRKINDNMGKYVAESIVKCLIKARVSIIGARVAILGFTFKENVPDTRNTKVMDVISELKEYGVESIIVDPIADVREARDIYGIEKFANLNSIRDVDAVALCVKHDQFSQLSIDDFDKMFDDDSTSNKVFFDIKGIYSRNQFEEAGYMYWSL